MSPEDQRIEIALASGWQPTGRPSGIMQEPDGSFGYPLDYLNDLNAMRTAVLNLSPGQAKAMRAFVWELSSQMAVLPPAYVFAEAFLKAVGKWK